MLTTALVTTCGNISFMCYPYFDSPAPFCSLLDCNKGGYFKITPVDHGEDFKSKQFYLPGTLISSFFLYYLLILFLILSLGLFCGVESNILITRSLSSKGVGHIEDFMPVVTQPHSTTLDLDAGFIFVISNIFYLLPFTNDLFPSFLW